MKEKNLVLWAVAAVLLAGPCSTGMALQYSVTYIPSLYNVDDSANAINNSGVVVGTTLNPAPWQLYGFVWDSANGTRILEALGPYGANPSAINSSNKIVGKSATGSNSNGYACYWNGGGEAHNLGILPGHTSYAWSTARDVNDNGIVAGDSFADDAVYTHAVIWDAAGNIVDLGLMGGRFSQAWGTNNQDDAVGYWQENSGRAHAFLWNQQTGSRSLQQLESATGSVAYAINDRGEIAGTSWVAGKTYLTFWDALGTPHNLGQLPYDNYNSFFVGGISSSGQIVGYTSSYFTGDRAFVWDPVGGLVNPGPADRSSRAMGINDLGQVVGSIYDPALKMNRALIWTPVPEPSALVTLLCAVPGLALAAYRRRGLGDGKLTDGRSQPSRDCPCRVDPE